MQNADLIKDFVEEAGRHTDTIETGLIKLETGHGDERTINDIFRAVHSVKGTAGFFALTNIVSLSHAMEGLLEQIRSGGLAIDWNVIDILLAANDCLKAMAGDIQASEHMDISFHLSRISGYKDAGTKAARPAENTGGAAPAAGGGKSKGAVPGEVLKVIRDAAGRGHNVYRLHLTPDMEADAGDSPPPGLIKKIESIGQVTGFSGCHLFFNTVLEKDLAAIALGIPEDSITHLENPDDFEYVVSAPEGTGPDMNVSHPGRANNAASPSLSAAPALPPAQAAPGEARKNLTAEDSVRVNVSLLNDLLDLASEMVLGRNQLLRVLAQYRKEIPGLNGVLQNIDGITTDLQEKIMQTRMQPLAKVFNKFPRFIRELSRKMAKDVNLQMEGIDVELDKSIIEALGDPLAHLVRNAVDHGIENPETRIKTGKPRTGTITLNAYHEGGHVNIDIIDDGAGIDIESIKRKALQNGIISHAEASLMGESELLGLLYRPGFSTAKRVTDLSGRGVGLDVVKTNIEKLGGVLEIITNPGQGTNFRLILPLTLAIIPSLIVEVKGQKFALPQVNLQEMLRVKPGDNSRKIELIGDSPVMRLRGKLIPVIHLAGVLGLDKSVPDTGQILRTLVIKSGFKRFGLVVDRIHDDEEILVKHLPRYLKGCKCYSGVTILGDGRTAMILDPEGIASKAGLRFMDRSDEKAAGAAVSVEHEIENRQSLLLFKCSGPETFGIDLSKVARVEKIQSDQIEKIGRKEFIQFRGTALRVIRPEKYLPVSRIRKKTEKLYVIIPKEINCPAGILIERILDTVDTSARLNSDNIKALGLAGSAILNGRVVLMINMRELLGLACPEHYGHNGEKRKSEDKKTVLLVEDTPFFSQTEKKYLESAGYRVLTAVNGLEAWKTLQEKHVDAVVSDIEMPVMDGYELVRKIRASRKFSGLPVVAVTSRVDENSRKKGMEAGFDFYEVKLNREAFLEKVRLAFQKGCDTG